MPCGHGYAQNRTRVYPPDPTTHGKLSSVDAPLAGAVGIAMKIANTEKVILHFDIVSMVLYLNDTIISLNYSWRYINKYKQQYKEYFLQPGWRLKALLRFQYRAFWRFIVILPVTVTLDLSWYGLNWSKRSGPGWRYLSPISPASEETNPSLSISFTIHTMKCAFIFAVSL